MEENEKILSREQYAQILTRFRKSNAKCSTNRWFMRSELDAMIGGEKLWAKECDGTLWFFSDEVNYYNAQVFAASDKPICLSHQGKDVVVELTGNGQRYDLSTERKLLAAGFEKYRKYLELECDLEKSIDRIREQLAVMRGIWGKEGLKCRKATGEDYPELYRLWAETIGNDRSRYTLPNLTQAQIDEMERYGRCTLICDAQGRILASRYYVRKDKVFYAHISASRQIGMGGWAYFENLLSEYEEGCKRDVGWIAQDNARSMNMSKNIKRLTGKYFWQFVREAQTPKKP